MERPRLFTLSADHERWGPRVPLLSRRPASRSATRGGAAPPAYHLPHARWRRRRVVVERRNGTPIQQDGQTKCRVDGKESYGPLRTMAITSGTPGGFFPKTSPRVQ